MNNPRKKDDIADAKQIGGIIKIDAATFIKLTALKMEEIKREREEKRVKNGDVEKNGSKEDDYADAKQIEEMMDRDPETFLKLKKMENQDRGGSNTVAVEVVDSNSYSKLKSELFTAARYIQIIYTFIYIHFNIFREQIDKREGEFNTDEKKDFNKLNLK